MCNKLNPRAPLVRGGSLVVCPVLAIATRGKMSNACSGQLEPVHSAGYTVFPRFLPAGTINFRACQDAGTIRGREQNEGGVNITRQRMQSRVLARERSATIRCPRCCQQ